MHGIEGDDAVRDMEFAEQLLRGGDFVGLFRGIDVCQDETGFDVEGVQHLGRLAIGEIVEWRMYRIEVWAGARRQCRPKATFNRRRCTLMKVTMER
jgi:hypothetical protein